MVRRRFELVHGIGAGIAGLLLCGVAVAGRPHTDVAELERLSARLEARFVQENAAALQWAQQRGIQFLRIPQPDGRVVELMYVREGRPHYFVTFNRTAADTVSTDELWPLADACVPPGGSTGLDLTGTGVQVHIWDEGQLRRTHQEFDGRASWGDNTLPSNSVHSTHVACTMVAQGQSCTAHGMANMATVKGFDFGSDESEMAGEAAIGARVSNHSYGIVAGWEFGDFGAGFDAYWFGEPGISTMEDYAFGRYSTVARDWDIIAYDAPRYLIVRAVGNHRDQSWVGTHRHSDGSVQNDAHPRDGGTFGYDSIEHAGNSKNILVVGWINDIIGGYSTENGVNTSTGSSYGPTDDGRVKPDIVANGTGLTSCDIGHDADYTSLSGSSMASPNAAGSMALLIEHWRNTHPNGDQAVRSARAADSIPSGGDVVLGGAGACCLASGNNCTCLNSQTEAFCTGALSGSYLGDGTECATSNCDCNGNGTCDSVDISQGTADCDVNGVIDSCEGAGSPCDMRSATLKGVVIHTADAAGATTTGPGPDYKYGWGLLNTRKAALHISLDEMDPRAIQELSLADGSMIEQMFTYIGSGPIRATICWTDPAGPVHPVALDPPNKVLVNDLDLRIVGPDLTVYQPYVLDGANPSLAAITGDNISDNVEMVDISAPMAGVYTLQITHKGTLSNAPQDVSLMLSGMLLESCGECQLYGDVEPPLCPSTATACDAVKAGDCDADVDDILLTLDDFSGAVTPAGIADIEPCGGGMGPDGIHGDGDTDVDDILKVLDAFSGAITDPACEDPCPQE